MFCSNCGHEIKQNHRFCAKCGAPVLGQVNAPATPQDDREPMRVFQLVKDSPMMVFAVTAIVTVVIGVLFFGLRATPPNHSVSESSSETSATDTSGTDASGNDAATAAESFDFSANTNPPKEGDIGSIGEGNYTVGRDIPAGEYKVYANGENASYQVFYDYTSSDSDNLIDIETFGSCSYVTLDDGLYVEFCNCSLDPIESCKPSTTIEQGSTYKVGFDIPAGTVTLVQDMPETVYGDMNYKGWYEVWTAYPLGTHAKSRAISAFESFEGEVELTLNDGEYFSIDFAKVKES